MNINMKIILLSVIGCLLFCTKIFRFDDSLKTKALISSYSPKIFLPSYTAHFLLPLLLL